MTPLDPPFISVEGTFNFRSVGGYPILSNPLLRVKPDFLFRSGELSGITLTGAETLASLDINTAFDLRAKNESDQWQTPPPHLANVKTIHVPVDQEVNFSPDFLDEWLSNFEKDELNAFLVRYREILTKQGPALEAVMRHLAKDPGPPIVHCTAGKDRTGILVAVILLLLGVTDSEVAEEYALTEIGLKPAYALLASRLAQVEAFRNNPVGTLNMGKSRGETMMAVIKMMREEYGSVEEYVLRVTSLTRDDLEALRKRVLVDA